MLLPEPLAIRSLTILLNFFCVTSSKPFLKKLVDSRASLTIVRSVAHFLVVALGEESVNFVILEENLLPEGSLKNLPMHARDNAIELLHAFAVVALAHVHVQIIEGLIMNATAGPQRMPCATYWQPPATASACPRLRLDTRGQNACQ